MKYVFLVYEESPISATRNNIIYLDTQAQAEKMIKKINGAKYEPVKVYKDEKEKESREALEKIDSLIDKLDNESLEKIGITVDRRKRNNNEIGKYIHF